MHIINRFFFALPILFAPWLYGTTEPWSRALVNFLCWIPTLLVVSDIRSQKRFRIRRPVLLAVLIPLAILLVWQLTHPVQVQIIGRDAGLAFTPAQPKTPFTTNPELASMFLWSWGSFALYGIALLHHLRTYGDARFFIKIMIINGSALGLVGLLMYFSGTDLLLWVRKPRFGGAIFGPYVCRNNFAACLNLLVPLALGFATLPSLIPASGHQEIPKRFLWALAGALMIASVVCSASRAGFLITALITAMVSLDAALRGFSFGMRSPSNPPKSRWPLLMLLILVAGMVIFAGESMRVFGRFAVQGGVDDMRKIVYENTLKAIPGSPLFGYGLGSFSKLFVAFQPASLPLKWNQTHNDWLQALFETGFIGLGLASLFLVLALGLLAKNRFTKESNFCRSIVSVGFIALVSCLLHAVVDFPLQIPSIQLTFVALLAISLSARYLKDE